MADYQKMCDEVLHLDRSIRYVGLADHLGSLIATVYKPGLVPLSTKEETEAYTIQAIQRMGVIQGGPKVGRLKYVVGRFENLIRATIPVVSAGHDKFYLMLSMDLASDPIKVIENKVLPRVEKSMMQI
ncbi:hypothetical protein Ngar_c05740 [Candidatus Nitrososphaera gargensis Ga9.2]|uniref:Roadblock/LAMTOR2 domain-containing protein n=1 Tax=Nitrososphaera gargensis (strain Ga9.2) TaxID=1237085 RepID=K0IHX8_NITGG|nr:hypothetical protein [Candidatus Nitrososphaera gargensis]AFU57517.1 hypothetical protein Ngar_c05740 [Candidatus Nitrososphaera gargensis Ga9.2]